MQWAQKQKGFTIVELLIVVVVIAILAAITIVAYTGIQNRAKTAAAQSTAQQAGKKLAVYAVQNSDTFPDESSYRSVLSLPSTDTAQATYDYYVSDDKKSFCLSVTNTTLSTGASYAYTTASSGTVPGRCIKNLASATSLEGGVATGWSSAWPAGSGISATASIGTNGGYSESSYRRWVIGGTNTTNGNAYAGGVINVAPSSKAVVSFWLRSSTSATLGILMTSFTAADGGGTSATITANTAAMSPVDTWVRRVGSFTFDSTILSIRPGIRATTSTLTAGQTVDADALMVVLGDVDYAYYDGNSPNWAWTGATNNSPSFGPALPY